MQNIIIGIPVFFVLLASVLLWSIILGKGKWFLKALFVPFVLYYCLVVYLSLSTLSGWATEEPMPAKFRIHWSIIEEPEKQDSDTGAIYVWASATEVEENEPVSKILYPFTSQRKTDEVRAYRLKYSQQLHESMEKTMEQIKSGKVIVGESRKTDSKKADEQQANGGNSQSQEQDFMLYELPPAKLPEKN